MLADSFRRQIVRMKPTIMACYDPSALRHDREPFIIGCGLRKAVLLLVMKFDQERRICFAEQLRQSGTGATVEEDG